MKQINPKQRKEHMKQIKNKKGLSLIEILVVMGLVGILATIAIPAYDNYRDNANTTVLKSDAGNGYKAYHAFNAVEGHFCGDLSKVGLSALKSSTTYTGDKTPNSFVGFGNVTACASATTPPTLANSQYNKGSPPTISNCELATSTFEFAVSNTFGGDKRGYYVSSTNSSPTVAGGTCSHTVCTTKAKCEAKHVSSTDCTANPTGVTGTWTPVSTLCN